MSPFTGQPGTVNSMPGNTVPMFGAGGTKRAKSLSGQLTSTGLLSTLHTFIFNQTSVTVYKAVFRTMKFITELRTNQ